MCVFISTQTSILYYLALTYYILRKYNHLFLFLPLMGQNPTAFTMTSPTETNKYNLFSFEMKNVNCFHNDAWASCVKKQFKLILSKKSSMLPTFLSVMYNSKSLIIAAAIVWRHEFCTWNIITTERNRCNNAKSNI